MATLPKLLYQNYGEAGLWTASSEKPSLPAINLALSNRNKPWRSNGAVSGVTLTVDLGSALGVDAVALISSNLTNAATIGIAANSSNSWGAPPFSTTLTPWTAANTGVMLKFLASTQTFRWWQITLTDAGNPDGFLQVGVVHLGPTVLIPMPLQQFNPTMVDPTIVGYTPARTSYVYQLPKYFIVELPIHPMADTDVYSTMLTLLRGAGRSKHSVFCFNPDAPSADALSINSNIYGLIGNIPAFVETLPQRYPWTLQFVESR